MTQSQTSIPSPALEVQEVRSPSAVYPSDGARKIGIPTPTTTFTQEENNILLLWQALHSDEEAPTIDKFAPYGAFQALAAEMCEARAKDGAPGGKCLKAVLILRVNLKKRTSLDTRLIQVLSGYTVSSESEQPERTHLSVLQDEMTVPPLPTGVTFSEDVSWGACRWLDDYVKFSRYWSPRGYHLFHAAAGAWLLAGVAARRVWLPFGPNGEYTSLYIALVATTTQHTKSTTAGIAKRFLKEIGLSWLLCPDTITPQKLLSNMAGHLPRNYQELTRDEQERAKRRYGMSGQVVWFYDEFGQHLDAMIAKNGIMADFKGMLRRFDDCDNEASNDTITRDLEKIEKPYLSLLASMTPADLRPYAARGAKFWRDGLFARFAFITPPRNERNHERFPNGEMTVPSHLVQPLRAWHERLQEPYIEVYEKRNQKDQVIGYEVSRDSLPQHTCTLGDGVVDAYYAYSDALDDIVLDFQLEQLSGNYGRMAKKALRLAILFASLENNGRIELRHWAKAQEIVETWRASLHELCSQVNAVELSEAIQAEDDILRIIRKLTREKQPPTAREVGLYLKRYDTPTLRNKLRDLALAGVLEEHYEGKAARYSVYEKEG